MARLNSLSNVQSVGLQSAIMKEKHRLSTHRKLGIGFEPLESFLQSIT
jgi:hypothetical protein